MLSSTETTSTVADRDSSRQNKGESAASSELGMDTGGGPLGGLLGTDFANPKLGSSGVLSSRSLSLPANTAVRGAALRQAQRSHGNQFVQRALTRGVQRSAASPALVQRECACGGTCASCQEASAENVLLQRSAFDATSAGTESRSRRAAQSRIPTGSGEPLGERPRSFMESRFGRDFSDVRLHTDAKAAESAETLGANAYSSGRDIYFARGKYAPENDEGKRLLAHELVHTIQQANTPSFARDSASSSNLILDPDYSLEQHADRAAEQIVSSAPVGAAPASGPPVPKLPSDVNLGFNALDAAHRLIESIDQSQIKIEDDPYDDARFFKRKRPIRHVDFPAVLRVLSNLTADQVKQVEAQYLAYEHRPLQHDLFGGGGGEYRVGTDLTVDQKYRLKALLGGTRASSEADAEEAAQHQREGDVAELHALLYGDLKSAEVERVMTLLRRPAEEATALTNEYDNNYNLRSDLFRMGYANAIRAMMLLTGSTIAADAYAIALARNRIKAIDEALAALAPTETSVTSVLLTLSQVASPAAEVQRRLQVKRLNEARKAEVQMIETRLQVAAGEARKEAESEGKDALDTDTAVRTRVSTLLGAGGATEAVVGGTSAKFIQAVARNEPSEQVAAMLRKLDEAGELTPEAMANAFRGLRAQAAEETQRRYPNATGDELKEEERKLSDQWFIHLEKTWDAAVVGDGPTFSQILDRGAQTDVNLKRDLYMASGKLSDADELVLALAGDRKDLETVKRVLRDKSADQIEELKAQYKAKTKQPPKLPEGRSLEIDLFGLAPTKLGQAKTFEETIPGKAKGTDRLLLEDYMQRPKQEGGIEEVNYIAGRAEREYEYTIDNRGATGWWRDHWGNEARSLLDATIKEVRAKRAEYLALVKYGTDPEAARSEKAHLIIRDMHFARATIRGDREGYEKATAELRATFQAIASFVLQAVLTAVLAPFAAALFAARLAQASVAVARFAVWTKNTAVGIASTIAANKTVYGNDYTTDMLLHDLKGGLGGAIGASGAGKLLGPVTTRLTDRLGKTMGNEVIAGAKTLGGMEATAVIEGEDANIFKNFLEQHFLGKVGEGITETTTKALKLGPKAGTHGGATEEPHARASGAGAEHEVRPAREAAAEPVDVDVNIPEMPTRVSMALPEVAAKPSGPAAERPAKSSAPVTEEPATGFGDEPTREITPPKAIEVPVTASHGHEPTATKRPAGGDGLDASVERSSHMDEITDQEAANEVSYIDKHPELPVEGTPPKQHVKLGEHEVVEVPGGGCERHSPGARPLGGCPITIGVNTHAADIERRMDTIPAELRGPTAETLKKVRDIVRKNPAKAQRVLDELEARLPSEEVGGVLDEETRRMLEGADPGFDLEGERMHVIAPGVRRPPSPNVPRPPSEVPLWEVAEQQLRAPLEQAFPGGVWLEHERFKAPLAEEGVTLGSTIPEYFRPAPPEDMAFEVKRWNLEELGVSPTGTSHTKPSTSSVRELNRARGQLDTRRANLPPGTTQCIVFNITGLGPGITDRLALGRQLRDVLAENHIHYDRIFVQDGDRLIPID